MTSSTAIIQPGSIIDEDTLVSELSYDAEYASWLGSLDAILVLGGGVPLSPIEPPIYVQRRCDVVARLFDFLRKKKQQHPTQEKDESSFPFIICLSAGTAHLPQYITPHNGLPLWESTASAAYLMQHTTYPIPEKYVFAETTSYDTISNAFFTRTSFTDVVGWKKLLVVTNEFHIHRTKAIFDWIFHVPSTSNAADTKRIDNIEGSSNYELYYLSCSNIGLTSDAIEARRSHEKRGEINVRTKLAVEYTTLKGVWGFLTKNHDFYSAAKLARSGTGQDIMTGSNTLLKASYGQSSGTKTTMLAYSGGMVILSLDIFVVLALLFIIVIGLYFTIKCRQTRLDSRNDNGLKCK